MDQAQKENHMQKEHLSFRTSQGKNWSVVDIKVFCAKHGTCLQFLEMGVLDTFPYRDKVSAELELQKIVDAYPLLVL